MAKRHSGLGRGIDALIPLSKEADEKGNYSKSQELGEKSGNGESVSSKRGLSESAGTSQADDSPVILVSINKIEPNKDQPRTQFDKEQLKELSDSIKENGLLQPIVVREFNNGYQIIAGERRWQACNMAGLEEVPVLVTAADDTQSLVLAMVENIQRSDLNPMEEAYGYKSLMKKGGMTQVELAKTVSKGRSTIANSLRLLDLPEPAQKLLLEGKISAGHARAVLSIPNEEGRLKLVEKMKKEQLTVRAAENLARLYSGKAAEKVKSEPDPPTFKRVAKELKGYLGTNVRVKNSGGKNKIEIDFIDEKDLERIFKVISERE